MTNGSKPNSQELGPTPAAIRIAMAHMHGFCNLCVHQEKAIRELEAEREDHFAVLDRHALMPECVVEHHNRMVRELEADNADLLEQVQRYGGFRTYKKGPISQDGKKSE